MNAIQSQIKRTKVTLPAHMVAKLDTHAKQQGVSRQALIRNWLADRLEQAA